MNYATTRRVTGLGVLVVILLSCSSDEPHFEPKNIFGSDDRFAVPEQYPYRAIGRIDSGCTGTLIGPSLVLTAAHCVVDSRTGTTKQNIGWFRPNFRADQLISAPAAWITRAWVGSENPDGNRLRDFAVLEIDQPFGKEFGTLSVRRFNISSQIPFATELVGYSQDKDNGGFPSSHRGCLIREAMQERLLHECDGYAGVSGGPMLNFIGQQAYVAAITVSEYRQGAPTSVTRDAYEREYANVAIPSEHFQLLVNQLLASVAIGRPAPVIPDITLKLNPVPRPGPDPDGSGPLPNHMYSVERIVSEQTIRSFEFSLSRRFPDLQQRVEHLRTWSVTMREPRLSRLVRRFEQTVRDFRNVTFDTIRGQYRGQHRQPLYRAWYATAAAQADLVAFPRMSGVQGIETELNRHLALIDEQMSLIEGNIFQ